MTGFTKATAIRCRVVSHSYKFPLLPGAHKLRYVPAIGSLCAAMKSTRWRSLGFRQLSGCFWSSRASHKPELPLVMPQGRR